MNFLLLIFLLLLSGAFAAPSSLFATKPSDDDFYNAPAGFENKTVGTILKQRVLPEELRSVILPVKVKNTWQMLVRSTDSNGNPNAFVTTLIEPYNADTSKLVSHQIAEDSSSPDCAVSYGLQKGAPVITTVNSQIEMVIVQAWLDEGWFVVLPDYEGPKAAYTAGRQAGHATLDSIKAVLNSGLSGIQKDARTLLFGYSGGALASGWAGALQSLYAPDLSKNLFGAAIGGFVTNITATAESIDGTLFAGVTAGALNGLANEYPDLRKLLPDYTNQKGVDELNWANNQCLIPNVLRFLGTKWFGGSSPVFDKGWGIFQVDIVKKIMHDNTLGLLENSDEYPRFPFFIFESQLDEVVPFKEVLRTFNAWKQLGAPSVEFNVDVLAGHVTEYVGGAPAAFTWVKKIMNGGSAIQGCRRTDRVSNLLMPGTPWGLFNVLRSTVKGLLLQHLGPQFALPLNSLGKRELEMSFDEILEQ